MAPYHHHVSTHHRTKRAKKVRKLSFFLVVLTFLFVGVVSFDWIATKLRSSTSVVSVESNATVQSSTINIFRTPFFQFQADDSWSEVPEVSTETKFVYKSLNGPLVEHQLTVFVNEKAPAKFAATRVFTTELDKGLFKKVSGTEKHCNTDEEGLKNEPKVVTFNQVTFNCDLGSNIFRVFVGIIGGTNEIAATRQNGETATYTIIYDDLTFLPSANQINSIMSTFQIR